MDLKFNMSSSVDMVYSMVTILMQVNVLEDQNKTYFEVQGKTKIKTVKIINSEYLIYAKLDIQSCKRGWQRRKYLNQ